MRLITQLHRGKGPIAKRDQSIIRRFVVFALHTLPVRSIKKSEFDDPECWLRTNRLKLVARVAGTSAA
jgi:hypothetical protein